MRYILIATLSAMAHGQSPESSAPAIDTAERVTMLAAKAERIGRATANSTRQDDKTPEGKISPVLLQDVTRRPVQWTLRRTVCSSLTSDLIGSGQGRTTVTLVRNSDGTFNYKIADEVIGSATDGNNHHYIFFYKNNQFIDSGSGIPRPQAPYNVYATDTFQLIPVDGGTGYTTSILFKARVNADGSFTDQGSLFGPNTFCDQI